MENHGLKLMNNIERKLTMAKSIWKGEISFGLVSIPVSLVSVEEKNELKFHLLDSKNTITSALPACQ
jgi:hypothetical protein